MPGVPAYLSWGGWDMLRWLADGIWNPWLLGLFLITGVYFGVQTGFFQLFRVKLWLKTTIGSLFSGRNARGRGEISQFQALSTALASTIGTGSVAGVATAIWFGGPGAVFWMWICAFLGMMTGCAEKILTIAYRQRTPAGQWRGGPMYYLRDGVGSGMLGIWFAVALLPATLAGGNLVQVSSIAGTVSQVTGCRPIVVGVITAALTGLVMVGGIGRIARVSAALVPMMALLYIGGGAVVLGIFAHRIPDALGQIFLYALEPKAMAGGGMGYTCSAAMRYGIARGVFTNEAGLGTAAIAHSAARTDHPARQGMWGIVEVGISTLVVSTMTALVILVSGVYVPEEALSYLAQGNSPGGMVGAPLTAAAFSAGLGPSGSVIVSVSLILFAFSSILGWSYYGQQALEYLTGKKWVFGVYRLVFLGCILLGSVWNGEQIWQLVDLCNACLAIPNLTALILLAPETVRWLEGWEKQVTIQSSKRSSYFSRKENIS